METKCHIMCADEMMVGRWYKIMCIPTNHSDTYKEGSEIPYHYWVKYHLENSTLLGGMEYTDNVFLFHDTVYVKKVGTFTITATDINGKSDTKTVTLIEEPFVERTELEIIPTSWTNLQELVTNTYTLYKVPKGVYDFELTDVAFVIPEGTIIDFNDSTLNITSGYKGTTKSDCYKGFKIDHDHSGIRNVNFFGNMYGDTSYLEWCNTVNVNGGYNALIENITFKDLVGFNFEMGGGPTKSIKCFTTSKEYNGAWKTNISPPTEGYIANDGSIATETGCWTHESLIPLLESTDGSYGVGHTVLHIYSTSKVYDIAFYDENKTFIELRRYQQFYRKYYYPENAKYIRYGVYQNNEPENMNPNDDICFIRQMGHFTEDFSYNPVVEATVRNIKYIGGVSSASINITRAVQDIHIDRVNCPYDGWYGKHYATALNFEDGWNSMMGAVLTHSRLATLKFNGIQGISVVSTKTGYIGMGYYAYTPTFINCVNGHPLNGSIGTHGENDIYCCLTAIDSYIWSEGTNGCKLGTEKWHHCYSFGTLGDEYVTDLVGRK